MKYVYVAGPLHTSGNPDINTRTALDVATVLLDAGMVPFVPHMNTTWNMIHPQTVETWIAWDLAWIDKCDALFRLPGDSRGADKEVAHAKAIGIPVFYNVDEILAVFNAKRLGMAGITMSDVDSAMRKACAALARPEEVSVLGRIVKERHRQNEKWGDQTSRRDLEWLAILMEEVGEASEKLVERYVNFQGKTASDLNAINDEIEKELVEAAATIVAWLEARSRRITRRPVPDSPQA